MNIPVIRLKSFWIYNVSWPQQTHAVTVFWRSRDSSTAPVISILQLGQEIRPAGAILSSGMTISPSHSRHLKCIIPDMKLLILILFVAMSAEAQTLADYARQERLRHAQVQNRRVYTNDDARGLTVPEAPKPAAAPAASAASAAAAPATTAPAAGAAPVGPAAAAPGARPAAPQAKPVDPAQKFREEVEKMRAKIRELQDQETALQLQVNRLTNEFFAPVTDEATRSQAQTQLGDAQNRLTALRGELERTRRTLAAMEAQGPARE